MDNVAVVVTQYDCSNNKCYASVFYIYIYIYLERERERERDRERENMIVYISIYSSIRNL